MTTSATPQPSDPTVEQINVALKAWNVEGVCLQDGEEDEDLNFLCLAAALRAYDSAALQSLRDELAYTQDEAIAMHKRYRATIAERDQARAERDTLALALTELRLGQSSLKAGIDAAQREANALLAERDRLREALAALRGVGL